MISPSRSITGIIGTLICLYINEPSGSAGCSTHCPLRSKCQP
ncbi:hypothetical protein RGAI101_2212 [Roseobacter sp. GAI101]|nr:hypothetical protein RGAI101_2212 [Roseobacter sp. GAI101]